MSLVAQVEERDLPTGVHRPNGAHEVPRSPLLIFPYPAAHPVLGRPVCSEDFTSTRNPRGRDISTIARPGDWVHGDRGGSRIAKCVCHVRRPGKDRRLRRDVDAQVRDQGAVVW